VSVPKQVITIGPGGEISGLQRKPGQGLDLRTFGDSIIRRASDIRFDDSHQLWFVQVLQPVAVEWLERRTGDSRVTMGMFMELSLREPKGLSRIAPPAGTLYFSNYDDAVAAEVTFLDALRLIGIC
jgi:hypothetical protein